MNVGKNKLKHLRYEVECRKMYHNWRDKSFMMKSKFLTIIHDNMNTRKTCILRLSTQTKATAKVGQIPMSLIGILIHGHGDGTYAHYGTALWPSDSNYFISSLCRVLRVLKKNW